MRAVQRPRLPDDRQTADISRRSRGADRPSCWCYLAPLKTEGAGKAAKLKQAAKNRADDAPLLLQSDGRPWDNNPGQNYHRQVDKVVTVIGLDPADVTMYALRHSSIVRQLKLNVPIRIIASTHDTSVAMIERHYSRYITEHSDDISRRALLQHELPGGENVVVLVG